MNKAAFITFLFCISLIACSPKINTSKVFADAAQQTEVMLKEVRAAKAGKADMVSQRTVDNGQLRLVR